MFLYFPPTSSSLKDMQLICRSSSTTTALAQPSPAARAWCCAKAALVWAPTATSWGRGTTCCAPSPLSRPRPHRRAAATTGRSARRASRTVSGWSSLPARQQRSSAAWASQPAAGAAAAAPSWSRLFSLPNDVRSGAYKPRAKKKTKQKTATSKCKVWNRWLNNTIPGATNHSWPSPPPVVVRSSVYVQTQKHLSVRHMHQLTTFVWWEVRWILFLVNTGSAEASFEIETVTAPRDETKTGCVISKRWYSKWPMRSLQAQASPQRSAFQRGLLVLR